MSLAFSSKGSKEKRIEELARNGENMEHSVRFLRIAARHYKMQSGGDPSCPMKTT